MTAACFIDGHKCFKVPLDYLRRKFNILQKYSIWQIFEDWNRYNRNTDIEVYISDPNNSWYLCIPTKANYCSSFCSEFSC